MEAGRFKTGTPLEALFLGVQQFSFLAFENRAGNFLISPYYVWPSKWPFRFIDLLKYFKDTEGYFRSRFPVGSSAMIIRVR